MNRALKATAAVVLVFIASSRGEEPRSTQADIVRAMLERSRLLKDVEFRIPISVYEQYLREKAAPKKPPPAPLPLIAEESVYTLTAPDKPDVPDAARPRLAVKLRLRVFDPEACSGLRVLADNLVWESLAVNDKETKLPVEKGWYLFSPPEPGVYEIAASAPLESGTGQSGSFRLRIPRTVRTLLDVESPRVWEVVAAGAPPLVGTKEKGARGRIALTPTDALDVRYGPPTPRYDRRPVCHLSGDVAWNIDVGRMQVTARLDVAILGGATDRIDLTLPPGATRAKITGPDVREAQISGGSAAIYLRDKTAERTRLTMEYELPAPAGDEAAFAPPTVSGGRWSGGTLVVTHTRGGSEIIEGSSTGLEPIVPAEIPASAQAILAGAPALAYRIASPSFSARVEVVNLGEFALRESIADLAHFQITYRRDGTVLCKADYEIRNRDKQFLTVTLPAGAVILTARVNDKARPVTLVGGKDEVYLLPLERSLASVQGLVSFPVEIVFLCRAKVAAGATGTAEIPVPRVDLPIAYAWCEAYLPQDLEAVKLSGPLRNVERYSSETATASLAYGASQAVEGYQRGKRFTAGTGLAAKPPETGVPSPERVPMLGRLFTNRFGTGMPGAAAPVQPKVTPPKPSAKPAPAGKPSAPPAPSKVAKGPVTGPEAKPADIISADNAALNLKLADEDRAKAALGFNYYRAGKDAYEQQKYDEAEAALRKVAELAPKSNDAENAKRLLSNIKLARGELALKSKSERAEGAKVRREIESGNVAVVQEQRKLVESYKQALAKGATEEAGIQYKAAEALSQRLVEQGESAAGQEVLLKDIRERQRQVEQTDKDKVAALLGEVKALKEQDKLQEALQAANKARLQLEATGGVTFYRGGGKGGGDAAALDAKYQSQQKAVQSELQDLAVKVARQEAEESRANLLAQQSRVAGLEADWRGGEGQGQGQGQAIVRSAGRDRGMGTPDGAQPGRQPGVQIEARFLDDVQVDILRKSAADAEGRAQLARLTAERQAVGDQVKAQRDVLEDRLRQTEAAVRELKKVVGDAGAELGDRISARPAPEAVAQPRVQTPEQAVRQLEVRLAQTKGQLAELRARSSELSASRSLPRVAHEPALPPPPAAPVTAPGGAMPGVEYNIDNYEIWSASAKLKPDWGSISDQPKVQADRDERKPGAAGDELSAWYDTIRYPKNWEEIRKRTEKYGATQEEEAARPAEQPIAAHGAEPRPATQPGDQGGGTVTRVYDIRHLTAAVPNVVGGRIQTGSIASNNAQGPDDTGRLVETIRGNIDPGSWTAPGNEVTVSNGKLVVRQGQANQVAVANLLNRLAEARGPQVDVQAGQIALQRAKGIGLKDGKEDGGWTYNRPDRDGDGNKDALDIFVSKNYFWALNKSTGKLVADPFTGALIRADDTDALGNVNVPGALTRPVRQITPEELVRKLRLNRGQKVQVNSTNLNVDNPTAARLGVRFTRGNNDTTFAVVDEAQLRTLMQMDSANRRSLGAAAVAANDRRQEAIVGTDALLANGMFANTTFAAGSYNTLDVNGNPVNLEHEKYVVIDNGRYLTAVRTSQMQFWTETPEEVSFASVPETIDIPRVGQMLKFEKTLVRPSDELVIRVTYRYPEGD